MKRTISIKPLQLESLYSTQAKQRNIEKCSSSSTKHNPNSYKSTTQKTYFQKQKLVVDLKNGLCGSSGDKDSFFKNSLRSHFLSTNTQKVHTQSSSGTNKLYSARNRIDTELSTESSVKSTKRNDHMLPFKDNQQRNEMRKANINNKNRNDAAFVEIDEYKSLHLKVPQRMFSQESDQEEEDEYLVTDYFQKIHEEDNQVKIKSNKFTFHGNFTDRTSSITEAEGPMTSRFGEAVETFDERGSYCEQNLIIPHEGSRMNLNNSQRKIFLSYIKAF